MAKKKAIQSCNLFSSDNSLDYAIMLADESTRRLNAISNPYIGNKAKMLVEITKFLYEEEVYPFDEKDFLLDAFGGSGNVSYLFRKLGATVVYNDILTSSCLFPVANIVNQNIKISEEEWAYLRQHDSGIRNGYVQSHYAGIRFTERESQYIDNYRGNVVNLYGEISENIENQNPLNATTRIKNCIAMSTMLSYIMDRCQLGGRLNHGQIFADLEHRIDHPRNKGSEMYFDLRQRDILFESNNKCFVHNRDIIELLNDDTMPSFRLAYIDPPYGGDQSDYSFMYSFSEEYVWQCELEKIPWHKASKRFAKSKDYETEFDNLISSCDRCQMLLLSYNDRSWSDINGIEKAIKNHRKEVSIKKIDYSYKQRKDRGKAIEYLILAR